jgi:hypothetical protein
MWKHDIAHLLTNHSLDGVLLDQLQDSLVNLLWVSSIQVVRAALDNFQLGFFRPGEELNLLCRHCCGKRCIIRALRLSA